MWLWKVMKFWVKMRPSFWDKREVTPGTATLQFTYRRMWKRTVLLTGGVSLIPLISITVVNFLAMRGAVESEYLFRTTRVVSNTKRAISFSLSERKSALDFIVHDNGFENLNNKERLSGILRNLKLSFGGGFVDIGVVDAAGYQKNYVGPYMLEGKDYSGQEWFREVLESGIYISDVFLGYRRVPHLIIAVRGTSENGCSSYVLRASLSIAPFEDLVYNLMLAGTGDAFIINHEGILQTSTRYHGGVQQKLSLPVADYSSKTMVREERSPSGQDLIIGYSYINETPFILMIVKSKRQCMEPCFKVGLELIAFLGRTSRTFMSRFSQPRRARAEPGWASPSPMVWFKRLGVPFTQKASWARGPASQLSFLSDRRRRSNEKHQSVVG